jgi:Asp-tRNA(Asn)/Glu-tRNA(Gln) amidotransferase A subunit family amidase
MMAQPYGPFPRLFPDPDQTIEGIGLALRAGRTSCLEILDRCLAQVDEWEPKVHAWVILDRERARAQAIALDAELKAGHDRGPLHGIPLGIKDIIDVAGLPTACGAKRWANNVADRDAVIVASLRSAGAVIMGKTVTTPYAWIDPPVTRNPWNLNRTPGGSSSGSAAAVACGMCYAAIGTQTGGSLTRPASFCGVAAMKPCRFTSAIMVTDGIFPFAHSLDHVGPIARTVRDLQIVFKAMQPLFSEFADDKEQESSASSVTGPKLGRLLGFFDRRADPVVKPLLDDVVQIFEAAGAEIVELDDRIDFEAILKDHRTVMAAEAAAVHSLDLDEFPYDYPPRIRELILEGRSISAMTYIRAEQRMKSAEKEILAAFNQREREFWITPATIGTAVETSSTGDPAFNSPWSYTGLPTVSFPIGLAADNLPVAIQLVGWSVIGEDRLLPAAAWCEQALRAARQ